MREKYIKQENKMKPVKAMSWDEFSKLIPDEESAKLYIERQRWGGNVVCPFCGSAKVKAIPSKNGFRHCSGCRGHFSIRTNTIFHRSHIPLRDWLYTFYEMVLDRRSMGADLLKSKIKVDKKTAHFALHRIRYAMDSEKYKYLLKGHVEYDETYIGGLMKNMHYSAKKKLREKGRGAVNKTPVIGGVERGEGGKIVLAVAERVNAKTVMKHIKSYVEKGSTVNTDESKSYNWLDRTKSYAHQTVNHKSEQYVNGEASTNKIESVWAVFKRRQHGTHVKISKEHLHRYVAEHAFRWNELCKWKTTMEQVNVFLDGCFGKRLIYKDLAVKKVHP